MFGEREDLEMFKEIYGSIMKYLKKGYVNINAECASIQDH